MQRRVRVQPRFWLFVIVVMLICFGISCVVTQLRYDRVSDRLESLNREKFALQGQLELLSQRLEYVRTEDYVERVARDELNMLRPGEIRYVAG